MKNTYAWVGSGKKLVKFATLISSPDSTVDLSVTLSDKQADISKPTNVVTLRELKSLLSNELPSVRALQNQTLSF
jgi:hypothetical protein